VPREGTSKHAGVVRIAYTLSRDTTHRGGSMALESLEYGSGQGAPSVRCPQQRGILGIPPETSRPLTPGIPLALCGCPTPTRTLPTRASCDAHRRTREETRRTPGAPGATRPDSAMGA